MLHLKKVDGGKTQLLVRAETNLGNILLNILVNDQMNIDKRKNNIQFGCIPNPPIPGIMNNELGKNFVKSLFTKKKISTNKNSLISLIASHKSIYIFKISFHIMYKKSHKILLSTFFSDFCLLYAFQKSNVMMK